MDEMLMIRPERRFIIGGRTRWVATSTPCRFTPKSRFHSVSEMSRNGVTHEIPALLMRMSIKPSSPHLPASARAGSTCRAISSSDAVLCSIGMPGGRAQKTSSS